MEVKRYVEITIILVLAEAKWLKEVLHNPTTEHESEAEVEMRESLWKALDREGIK